MSQQNNRGADRSPIEGVRPATNPARERLAPLVGEWELTASIDGTVMGHGRTEFTWMEGGAFLLSRADGVSDDLASPEWVANSPMPVSTITGLDDSADEFTVLHADSRNVARVYRMNLREGVITMWRDAPGFFQRFTGTFSDDGKTITSYWERSDDGETWQRDFDLAYTRV